MVAAANVTVGGTNAESIYELLGFGVEVGGGGGYIFGGTGAVVRGHDKFWNEKHTEKNYFSFTFKYSYATCLFRISIC